jgi:16S rRNA processing protein RimM
VAGEVRVEVLTDFPDRFAPGARLYLGPEGAAQPEPVDVRSVRTHRAILLVALEGTTTREQAQVLAGRMLYVPIEEARALEADSYYEHDLVGMAVETEDGDAVGVIERLIETGSADVVVIRPADAGAREVLVPLTGEIVREVDVARRRMRIRPLPGLLD